MRIVHIEDFFYPLAGYQINILPKYLQKLGHENYIITSEYNKTPVKLRSFFNPENINKKDDEYTHQTNVQIIRAPIYKFFSGRAIWRFKKLIKIIEKINPDVIYVHGNDTFVGMAIILYYKNDKRRVISDSHMLEMASKNKFNKLFRWFYRHTVSRVINQKNIKVIRVQDTDFIFKNYNIDRRLSPFISFGSDIDLFKSQNKNEMEKLKNKLNIKNENIYIYSGKINEEKGSKLLINAFEKRFNNKEVTLLIVGTIPKDQYGEEIKRLINKSENQIIVLGTQEYNNLAYYYDLASFAVFPKQCSLSFYDFQAMGKPVIFEHNEINVSRAKDINFLFNSNDLENLRKVINDTLLINNKDYILRSQKAQKWIQSEYDYNNIVKLYENILLSIER